MTRKRERRRPIHRLYRRPEEPVEVPANLPPHTDREKYIAFERQLRVRERESLELQRRIMDAIGMSRSCPRKACRRAGRCVTEDVACHHEHRHHLATHIYPHVRGAMRRAEMRYAAGDTKERKK
jgi:hypothetical protein